MGNPRGYIDIKRKEGGYRPVSERKSDFGEVEQTLNHEDRVLQASRCMDCGVPFCHWSCPTSSRMPEWQDAVYRQDWEEACNILHSTNSFPEFTGRVCPALCEKSCVLAISNEAVTIRENEASIVEKGFQMGYIKPCPPASRSGKKVAIIGSGPAGLSCADLLNKAGHSVTVFEKDSAIGGLLRFGIPDFKLNKDIIDRRLDIFSQEGIVFKTDTPIDSCKELLQEFDAVCLAIGAQQPRDLPAPGRELTGVHFAMDYLSQQNRMINGETIETHERISARGKKVLVIGGGDTGSDCVGTAIRQKATQVTQIELLPKPPEERTNNNPWPYWPNTLRTSSSHMEGCNRQWSLSTKCFKGSEGKVSHVDVVQVEWTKDKDGNHKMVEVPGSEQTIEADLVLLAMGFVHPIHKGLVEDLKLELSPRGNIKVDAKGQTSNPQIFSAGDAATGASLVVRALSNGRTVASSIHHFLK